MMKEDATFICFFPTTKLNKQHRFVHTWSLPPASPALAPPLTSWTASI